MITNEQATMNKDEIFKKEMEPFLSDVFSRALYYTKNEADANDLTQETFLNAFKGLDTFTLGTNARAWLMRICHNAFVNDFRKKKRGPDKVDLEERTILEEDSDWVTMDDILFDTIMSDEVEVAMNQLNGEQRMLIIMTTIDGYKYKEVSEELGIELNTVRTKIYRAKNILKKHLKDYGEENGFIDKR